AVEMAYNLDAELIVVFTSSGTTALRVSRNRPPTPVLAITPNARAQRQLAVAWGVVAYQTDDIHDTDEMVDTASRAIAEKRAVEMAYNLDAELIVVFPSSGTTALRVSRNRPPTPVLAITPIARAQRQLAVAWGVVAYQTDDIHDTDEMVDTASRAIAEKRLLE